MNPDFPQLLREYSKELLRGKPSDLYKFCELEKEGGIEFGVRSCGEEVRRS